MNALLLTMMTGLLMGSVAVTVNGTAYPSMPYQNPLVFAPQVMNRELSLQDENKAERKNNTAQEMRDETSFIAGIDVLNEEVQEKYSVKTLSDWIGIFRFLEIYS